MLRESSPPHMPIWRTKRYQVAALFFLGCVLQSTLKYNLSIAIVCMVNRNTDKNNNNIVINNNSNNNNITWATGNTSTDLYRTSSLRIVNTDGCTGLVSHSNSSAPEYTGGEFVWSKQLQGFLLGGMFWGFTSGQVLCGCLSQRYGARTVIGLGVGGAALLTLLSPLTARVSAYLFMAVRVSIGLCLACVYPSLVVFWSRWAPPSEYSRMMGLSLSGSTLGNAVVFPVGGLLCGGGAKLGWPSVFYFTGGLTACWFFMWMTLVRDTPASTPGISKEERDFLEECLHRRGYRKKAASPPWCSMMTSRPVIALVITHTLSNYCLYMLFTMIPTYLYEILRLDIKSNGLYSMLPLVCMAVVTNFGGQVADFLVSRRICSVSTTRKIFNTLGSVVPGGFLVGLAYLDCDDEALAVSMLCLASGILGFNFCGHIINYGDIALLYAGTLSGIGNTFSSLSGVIAPYVVSAITANGTQTEWQTALYVAAGISGLSALVFIVFGSGEVQPWAALQTTVIVHEDIHLKNGDTGQDSVKDIETQG